MEKNRRESITVTVGGVGIGGANPVRVQSMTDTTTSDIEKTVAQILALYREGSELVRLAVLDDEDAGAIPEIRARLTDAECTVPLIGDFHCDGHRLLTDHPACAQALDKFRINPGNVGLGEHHATNFATILAIAAKHDKAIRIGANWGSLDETVRDRLLSNNKTGDMNEILGHAMIESTVESANFAIDQGFPRDKIVLSAKVSHIPTLLAIYRRLAQETTLPLHLGLTEAGTGDQGVVASTVAASVLLQEGIGDTLRVSITPTRLLESEIDDPRLQEVRVSQHILQSNGLRNFIPTVRSCPGCGRTNRDLHRPMVHLVHDFVSQHAAEWREQFPGSENLVIAVMGCVVNGIKEAKHADIGISLPGRGVNEFVPMLFTDGETRGALRAGNPGYVFTRRIQEYIEKKFS